MMLTIAVVVLGIACGKAELRSSNSVPATQPTAVPTTTQSKDGNYNGKGQVTKINTQLGSLELKHEEIIGLMPAMQMEFYVKDKSLLDGIAVGDKVEFVIEYKHPAETIVSVKKIQ
jgi:Cu(I)/Ag(I) efflux system protein CusF